MQNETKVFLRVEQTEEGETKLLKVIEFGSRARVTIPINRDGGIKWFDDSQLIKNEYRNYYIGG